MEKNRSIIKLPQYLLGSELQRDFNRIYSVEGSSVNVENVPETFQSQDLMRIMNKLTYDSTTFNAARSNRAGMINEISNEDKELLENGILDKPPFNDMHKNTPPSTAGRLEGKYCYACGNMAKFQEFHDLVVFKNPNPLNFEKKHLEDYLDISFLIFEEAEKLKREKLNLSKHHIFHRVIGWNSLWKAGSSIPHGHLQTLLYTDYPPMDIIRARDSFLRYNEIHGSHRDIFRDIFNIHNKLELGIKNKNTDLMVTITPKKEKEIILYTHVTNNEKESRASLVDSVYKSLRCLIDDFQVNSFNMSLSQLPLKAYGLSKRDVYLTRIVDRGNISNRTGDIAFMELLMGENIVSADPYDVMEKLKGHF